MSGLRYIRNGKNGAVLLADTQAIEDFRQKKTLAEEINHLKSEIDTLKTEVREMRLLIGKHHSE